MKPGKVVVMLSGRYAGCKAVVLKVHESSDDRKAKGAKARNTLIVCGLSSPPKAVTKKTLKANLKLEGEKKAAGVYRRDVAAKLQAADHALKVRYLHPPPRPRSLPYGTLHSPVPLTDVHTRFIPSRRPHVDEQDLRAKVRVSRCPLPPCAHAVP
jgi:hypothetical protein